MGTDLTNVEAAYAQWAGRCFRVAMSVTANRQLAEDAVQEAFCTWWRQRNRHDPTRAPLGPWLVMLTHHRAVDAVRREQRYRKTAFVHANDNAVLSAPEPASEHGIVTAQEQDTVTAAMQTLTPVQRQVLTLAYFAGHTQTQIAALLDIPLGTVKTRCCSGLRRLRAELDQPGFADSPRRQASGEARTTRPVC